MRVNFKGWPTTAAVGLALLALLSAGLSGCAGGGDGGAMPAGAHAGSGPARVSAHPAIFMPGVTGDLDVQRIGFDLAPAAPGQSTVAGGRDSADLGGWQGGRP